ncbi:MAG: cytochrome oxidase, mono-heme subunit/FixO [Geminicoccaceae bacterium]|jgi:cytochrome c oxidase cbb3-type subunit 2|nr:cytochrome oxidase, mono-heme subunit/FixO [Geminicoccaceae bacterium]
MTRISLIALGAFAIMASAICLLVIVPQAMLYDGTAPPQLQPYTERQLVGRGVYIANGCVYCHSQQVRDPSFTTDVDRGWGSRATVPADYAYDRPHLLGTMRTGPDLINVGQRLPDPDWQLIHLYDPRSVVDWSLMPAFPFLFEEKPPNEVRPEDRIVRIPGPRAPRGVTVVAKPEAIALVDYLISLKRQYPVSDTAAAGMRMASRGQNGTR